MTMIRKFGLKSLGFALMLSAMSSMSFAGDFITPEIDPGSMAGAVALLSSGVMMLTGRRRATK